MLALILSLLGLGGGIGALAYFVGPAALLGLGKSALGALAKIPWQIYAIAGLAALLAFLTISRGHFMDRAHRDEARIAEFCSVVRIANHDPKLDCTKAEAQVELMGQTVEKLTTALNKQNQAVEKLASLTASEQQAAAKAEKQAQGRAQEADAVSSRLAASSRSAPLKTAPAGTCEPSKALLDQWSS